MNTAEYSGFDWLPWIGAALFAVISLCYALPWWRRRRPACEDWRS